MRQALGLTTVCQTSLTSVDAGQRPASGVAKPKSWLEISAVQVLFADGGASRALHVTICGITFEELAAASVPAPAKARRLLKERGIEALFSKPKSPLRRRCRPSFCRE